MTDDDVARLLLEFSIRCGEENENCKACPLYTTDNDWECARYLMDVIRFPAAFMRGADGRVRCVDGEVVRWASE